MKIRIVALGALAALAASPALAGTYVWVKPQVSFLAMQKDLTACDAAFKESFRPPGVPYAVYATSVAAAGTTAFLSGFSNQIHYMHVHEEFEGECMHRKGFSKIWLKPDEEAEARALTNEAKPAWADKFAADRMGDRLAEAEKAQVAQLPDLKPEPFAFAGVRIVATSLKLVDGKIGKGEDMLTGRVDHRKTAKVVVAEDLRPGQSAPIFPIGDVFYAVDNPSLNDASVWPRTFWCHAHRRGGFDYRVDCISSMWEAYRTIYSNSDREWMVNSFNSLYNPEVNSKMKIVLEPTEADVLGPLDLSFRLDSVNEKRVRIAVMVAHNSQQERLALWEAPFNADGEASLPLWTKRLVLKRDGEKVMARLTDDGDGRGWMDPEPKPPVEPKPAVQPKPAADVKPAAPAG